MTDSAPPPRRSLALRCIAALLWLCVVAVYALVIYAWALPQDFSATSIDYVRAAWVAFAIRTVSVHLGLALCAVTVLALLSRRITLALAPLPVVAWTLAPAFWQFVPTDPPALAAEPIVVMSVNLNARNPHHDDLLAVIERIDPDVLLLQEYSTAWHGAAEDRLRAMLPFAALEPRDHAFGIALYSKLPFVEPATDPLGDDADVNFPQQRVVVDLHCVGAAIYNVHLIAPQMFDHLVQRRTQFAALLGALQRERRPVILGGDCNFTAASAQHGALRTLGLADTHRLAGAGFASTWPMAGRLARLAPGFRIDHLYVGPALAATTSDTHEAPGSDHRAISAAIGWAQPVR